MSDVVLSTGVRRVVAAIVTLAVVALLTVFLVGFPAPGSWSGIPLQLASRFFISLELLATSLLIAIPIGFALAALKARVRSHVLERAIGGSLLALRCTPFFVLALELPVVAARQGYFETGNAWSDNILVPAAALALFALPGVASFDFFRSNVPARQTAAAGCRCLVERLPELIAAQLLVEMFFAWPGEGRAFIGAIQMGRPGLLAPIVLCSAVAVVLLRLLVSTLAPDDATAI